MKHVRRDWAGIQDLRQWYLHDLIDGVAALEAGDPGEALRLLRDLVTRVAEATDNPTARSNVRAGSSIEEDEPIFLVRAKDQIAAEVVRFWADCARDVGASMVMVQRVVRWADEMEAYAAAKRASGEWGPPHPPDAPEMLP